MVTAVALGIIGFGFLWWVVKGATSGVPGKRQAFVEMCFDFVDEQVKGIFHGDRKFVAPLALTVFVWVVLMNAMDFIPADLIDKGIVSPLGGHAWRPVPTADVNTTFALALSVWGLMIFYSIKVKGLGGWIHELFCSPFGSNPLLWLFNFLFNLVEYLSKPLSAQPAAVRQHVRGRDHLPAAGPLGRHRGGRRLLRWTSPSAGRFSTF